MHGKHARKRNIALVGTLSLALSGCLSQEESNAGFAPDSAPPAENSAPSISGSPDSMVMIGEVYTFTPDASDPDGDTLTFSVENAPPWATFDTALGTISGRPTLGNVGIYSNIRISVSDGQLTDNLAAFSIEVATDNSNTPPTISGDPPVSADAGSAYDFTPTASDPDGDALVFSIVEKPAWASFDDATGRLAGMPIDSDVGTYDNIVIEVSDGTASDALAAFSITVNAIVTNTPPSISGSPPSSVNVDDDYSFTPTASDADGDSLTFSVSNLPGWASFESATGHLFGTPVGGDAGTYSGITISVSDGAESASLGPFSVTVNAVVTNMAPTISGSPPTSVDADVFYSFLPTASDPDGDALTFSVGNQPIWAAFDSATGRLFGTPGESDVGEYRDITITVSDGSANASLGPFSITVNAVVTNTPPTISGSPPASVNAGDSYIFTPTASDADGDVLTFSVSNLPVWVSFDRATGQLSGVPGDADVGVYGGILITVSDGTDESSLGPFAIEVNAVSLGSVTLTWTAPTENDDGSPLTDLAGYKLYWGTTPGSYTESVTIDNPGLTSYVIENLSPGTYEFVATSFNSTGVESTYSNPTTKVVQ